VEFVSGNIFIRQSMVHAAKGSKIEGHKHAFDHTTIVFTGAVHVRATLPDGGVIERDFAAPSHFLVKSDVEHEITATEDDTTFWCVYSHRTPQGDVVQEWTGWHEATL
jgi:quercetin dioxygenase-like cupin family protein